MPPNHDSTVMLSMLEHWSYCPRQCGLIHLESIWDENIFTLKGQALHQRVDESTSRKERGRRVERGLPIWSDQHGLYGRADVVEFDRHGAPMPVEYKSGGQKIDRHTELQLCGQALCLEEMFSCEIPGGAIFFAASQKRVAIELTPELRRATLAVAEEIRAMLISEALPTAKYDAKCRKCSLIDACLPQALSSARGLLGQQLYKPAREAELP